MNGQQDIGKGVTVFVQGSRGRISKAPVTHSTKTQIHVEGVKYRRSGGSEIGGDTWSSSFIRVSTPEIEEAYLKQRAEQKRLWALRQIQEHLDSKGKELGIETLEKIQALLKGDS